jgi:hypothetical protein
MSFHKQAGQLPYLGLNQTIFMINAVLIFYDETLAEYLAAAASKSSLFSWISASRE